MEPSVTASARIRGIRHNTRDHQSSGDELLRAVAKRRKDAKMKALTVSISVSVCRCQPPVDLLFESPSKAGRSSLADLRRIPSLHPNIHRIKPSPEQSSKSTDSRRAEASECCSSTGCTVSPTTGEFKGGTKTTRKDGDKKGFNQQHHLTMILLCGHRAPLTYLCKAKLNVMAGDPLVKCHSHHLIFWSGFRF